ncbi:MAG: protein O-GlcNAcase [Clostridia bacterium]|nr:protein O-GlcNAcase [Clostridia bacterium]
MIFPNVKKKHLAENSIVFPEKTVFEACGDGADDIKRLCGVYGYEVSPGGNVRLRGKRVFNKGMLVNENGAFTDERYALEIAQGDIPEITITYCFERALRHALNTAKRIADSKAFEYEYIEDYPSFTKRGFIEGFYGKPWEQQERFSVMRLMSQHHMNTYFYAPKYDPYHRERWQDRYDGKSLEKLSALVKKANELGLDFVWCIAPGLTVQYSGQEQFFLLMDKLKQVYDIGVRHFGVLLDDISPALQYENDRIAFDSLEQAHICYINNIYRALKQLDSENTLVFCPFQYHGTGREAYISQVGSGLKREIDIFWTGRNICSQELTCAEAVTFFENTGHTPLYWDNYPVNDAEMVNEMHISPVIGREKELSRYSSGLIANCMPYAEAGKIPLITVADYLWNSGAYSPKESFEYACEEINGKGTYRSISYFTDNLFFSCLKDDNSVIMNECLYRVQFDIRTGKKQQAAAELKTYTDRFCKSTNTLSPVLQRELSFWLEKHSLCADLLIKAVRYLEEETEENRKAVETAAKKYNMHPARHADFCLQEFIDFLLK